MRLILSLFRLFPFTLHVSGPYWPPPRTHEQSTTLQKQRNNS
jgi:hypothetical protein